MRKATRQSTGGALTASQVSATFEKIHNLERRTSRAETVEAIKSYFSSGDVQVASKVLTLICPISKSRIVYAVRGVGCRHLECFDLRSFLQLHTAPAFWECPFEFCQAKISCDQLRIDDYFTQMLHEVNDSVRSVELLNDGDYRAVEQAVAVDVTIESEEAYEAGFDEKPTIEKQPDTSQSRAASPSALPDTPRVMPSRKSEALPERMHQSLKEECMICRGRFRWLKVHLRAHTGEKPFKCDVCGTAFSQHGTLKTQQLSHSKIRKFECHLCHRKFLLKQHMEAHERRHKGIKLFTCDICGRAFDYKATLNVHKRAHNGDRPFKCDVCGKECLTKSNLKSHQRTHTGVKPYACKECGFTCSYINNLTVHARQHTGEKPYKCDVCGKSFIQWSQLEQHNRVHTTDRPFKCPTCQRAFVQKNGLALHVRTHTGEKPYACSLCGKAFVQAGGLKLHVRSHTGEKPFGCDKCGKKSSSQSSVRSHELEIHMGIKRYRSKSKPEHEVSPRTDDGE